jgi:HEAT repeat protein
MFQALKIMSLASALKARGNAPEALSAVVELGRIGNEKAIDLLVGALARRDGVTRAAARELGRIGHPSSIAPLVQALPHADVSKAVGEALVRIGAPAVAELVAALKSPQPVTRFAAANVLGEIGSSDAVDALVNLVMTDDDYAVRTAAATALGQIKDQKGIWGLVNVLRLRDETTAERQAALEGLRQAASRALNKIGSPLAKAAADGQDVEAALKEMEQAAAVTDSEVHPRLVGDLHLLKEPELVEVLNELIRASEEVSWASLERRDPMLASWFKTYELRAQAAQTIGKELHRRGGSALMRKIWEEQLGSYASVSNWWAGIGGWD